MATDERNDKPSGKAPRPATRRAPSDARDERPRDERPPGQPREEGGPSDARDERVVPADAFTSSEVAEKSEGIPASSRKRG
jgi:hypothetical protein